MAEGAIAEAFVNIRAKTNKFRSDMNKVDKKVKGTQSKFSALGKAIAGAFAARAVLKGLKALISAFAETSLVTSKLTAVLKATGEAAGFNAEQMDEMGNSLVSMTTFTKNAITDTQALLATFKNVRGDEFKRATIAILDMAEVMGTEAKSGAIQLGKALNDPIIGVGALAEVGVSFTQVQKDLIRVLQESGDIMGAQKVILEELEGEFGGAAEAASQTFGGALKQLTGISEVLKSSLGQAFVELLGMGEGADFLKGKMQGLTEKIQALSDANAFKLFGENVKRIFKTIGVVILAPFKTYSAFVSTLISNTIARFKLLRDKVKSLFKKGDTTESFADLEKRLPSLFMTIVNETKKSVDEITRINEESAAKINKIIRGVGKAEQKAADDKLAAENAARQLKAEVALEEALNLIKAAKDASDAEKKKLEDAKKAARDAIKLAKDKVRATDKAAKDSVKAAENAAKDAARAEIAEAKKAAKAVQDAEKKKQDAKRFTINLITSADISRTAQLEFGKQTDEIDKTDETGGTDVPGGTKGGTAGTATGQSGPTSAIQKGQTKTLSVLVNIFKAIKDSNDILRDILLAEQGIVN